MPRFWLKRLAGSTPSDIEPTCDFRAGFALRAASERADLAAASGVAPASFCAVAVEAAAAEPVGSKTICCGVTEPGSGIATPVAFAGLPLNGKLWPECS